MNHGTRPRHTRRLVQLYSALLHNACVKGFIDGHIYRGGAKYACVPGLNCYSCPGATGACPLGSIQNALSAAGHRAGWYVLGILLLYGVILGRTVCGWLCPAGLIQELLNKIPTPKLGKSRVTRALSWLKYALLAVFVVALPLWYGLRSDLPLPAFCKYICPAGTLEGAVGHLANPANAGMYGMLGGVFTRKLVIMLAIALACVFCYRAFCRFICPLGAIYGLFNRFNVIGAKVDAERCNRCGACVRVCAMDVRRLGDRECIHCGKCMDACAQGAISIRAGRIVLKAPKAEPAHGGTDVSQKRRAHSRIIRCAAPAILCLALVWFNVLDPAARQDSKSPVASAQPSDARAPLHAESAAPIGHEVGQRLEDFSLPCYDGTQFHLADTLGKVTFINLWSTSCTPCKRELPWFSDLYRAHEGDVAMLVVHASLVVDDPAEYLADKGYAMPFATDTDDAVQSVVGGAGVYPQTIVLNRRGEVIYNRVGSVTPELLVALFDEASGANAEATQAESPARLQADGPTETAVDGPTAGEATADDGGEYRVVVRDQDGEPVEGATIQLCDDTTCLFRKTGADGVATFRVKQPMIFDVHVLKVPEGYAPDKGEFKTQAAWSDLDITLERAS